MIFSWIIFSFLIKTFHTKLPLLWLIGMSAIVCFTPIYMGNSLSFFLTGWFSQLSILSVIFYVYWLFDWRIALDPKKLLHFKLSIIMLGALLYGMFLFSNQYSLYALGFGNFNTLLICFLILSLCVIFNYWFMFFCLILTIIFYTLNKLESQNLFDYLIDPFLWLILPFSLKFNFWRRTNESQTD
ncbi:hypothetical protein [Marinicellulosiphila megalodicopiae]|uniref:hypothetical protein n=1 Tax=Marinicellulosiphila megalodicopiae TaxID=2724896 RepID=UPI003BB179EB